MNICNSAANREPGCSNIAKVITQARGKRRL